MCLITAAETRRAAFRSVTVLGRTLYLAEDVDELLDRRVVPTLRAHETDLHDKLSRCMEQDKEGGRG
jgi:hypothetical protein